MKSQYSKLIGLSFLLTFLMNPIYVLGLDNKVSNDSVNDIYQFDIDYIDNIGNELIDGSKIERSEINNIYNELYENKDSKGKIKNTPNEIDITGLYFSSKNHNLTIEVSEMEIKFSDTELLIGFIWNTEIVIIFMMYDDYSFYYNLEKSTPEFSNEIDIKDNKLTLSDDIPKDFDDSIYIKMMLVFIDFENEENIWIDFYDSREIDDNYLFWIIFLIIILVLVGVILVIHYYKKRG